MKKHLTEKQYKKQAEKLTQTLAKAGEQALDLDFYYLPDMFDYQAALNLRSKLMDSIAAAQSQAIEIKFR